LRTQGYTLENKSQIFYQNSKTKNYLIPAHFHAVRMTLDEVFSRYVNWRNELCSKFPFVLNDQGHFRSDLKDSKKSLTELASYFCHDSGRQETLKRSSYTIFTGLDLEKPQDCYNTIKRIFIDFILEYEKKVEGKPDNLLTTPELILKGLSKSYNTQLLLLPTGDSQEKREAREYFDAKILSQIFDNVEKSEIVLQVLSLEITERCEGLLGDYEDFVSILNTHENIGASLSQNGSHLTEFPSIKSLQGD
jgi:hypothetical protein